MPRRRHRGSHGGQAVIGERTVAVANGGAEFQRLPVPQDLDRRGQQVLARRAD